MPSVAGARKCRAQGCQRKPLFVDPSGGTDASEATHCPLHRKDGFTLQEGFSLQDGFLLQHGQMVLNDYRGSSAYRNSKQNITTTTTTTTAPPTTTTDNTGGGKSPQGGTQTGRGQGGGRTGGKGSSSGRGSAPGSARASKPRRASRSLTCQVPGCTKGATYGSLSEATRCSAHKEKGQIDHKHRLCENAGCPTQPSFGWPGESRKRFCGAHRRAGTVDLRNCEHKGCGTRASHGFGKGKARFCALHSPSGSSLVANRPCEKLGCIVSPRFGDEGGRPRFCASHKEPQMVNLKDRRCEQRPCKIQPTFAAPGEKPRFCSKHKSEGHVNVRHKLCRHPGCNLVPTYGMRGTRVPVACLEHSGAEMVDLKRERMRMSQAKKAQRPVATAAGRAGTMGTLVVEGTGAGSGVGGGTGTSTSTATAAVGRKRPRGQSLGGNVVVGRKIADAIFTSSQRVLAVEETAATDESEWEGESSQEEQGEEEEESEEEEGGRTHREDRVSGSRSAPDSSPPTPLPTALALPPAPLVATATARRQFGEQYPSHVPPPLPGTVFPFPPPTAPAIANTNGGEQRLPFHASPLALLPEVVPREGPAAQALQMVAAVAAVASAAGEAAQHDADAVGQGKGGQETGKCARKGVSTERPSVAVRRMLPGFLAPGGEHAGGGDGGGDGDGCGSKVNNHAASAGGPNGQPSASPSPPRLGSSSAMSAPAPARARTPSSEQARATGTRASMFPGGSTESNMQVSHGAGTVAEAGTRGVGTSLSWSCVRCDEVIGPGDRHVLVCCGYGLLHKACTAAFVRPAPSSRRLLCPKCSRPVSSSLQVFV